MADDPGAPLRAICDEGNGYLEPGLVGPLKRKSNKIMDFYLFYLNAFVKHEMFAMICLMVMNNG